MMNYRSNFSQEPRQVNVRCEECDQWFLEFMGVVVSKTLDPEQSLLCLRCDPEAETPAVTRVVDPAPRIE